MGTKRVDNAVITMLHYAEEVPGSWFHASSLSIFLFQAFLSLSQTSVLLTSRHCYDSSAPLRGSKEYLSLMRLLGLVHDTST
jgi:hypothetical protein